MENLKPRWGMFFKVILDPWTLLFLGATTYLLFGSTNQEDASAPALYALLTTITSVVLGSRLTKLWVDISEGGALRGRGKAAVRGLKLLLSSIVSLDRKAQRLLRSGGTTTPSAEVMSHAMEEVRERCDILAEEAVNAIENWTDIVPEADIKSQIGLISELKVKLENRESGLRRLGNQLSETQNKSKEEMNSLRKRYQEKELEAEKVKEELRRQQVGFGNRFFTFNPSPQFGLTGLTLSTLSQSLTPLGSLDFGKTEDQEPDQTDSKEKK